MKLTQYTIRNVSPQLDSKLRAMALREKKSLNSLLLEQLNRSVEPAESKRLGHDYDDLAGTWVDDPDFDVAMQDMRRIDPKDWQ